MSYSQRLKRKYTESLVMKGQDSETFSSQSFQKLRTKDTSLFLRLTNFCYVALLLKVLTCDDI